MAKPTCPIIKCHNCHGSGTEPLGSELWETLQVVRQLRRAHAIEVAKVLRWDIGKVSAINNRLRYLMNLGFLTRKRDGKYLHYMPVK